MRSEEEVRKAYALTAQAADETQEEQPMESATAFVLMQGLSWVLEEDEGDGMYEDLEEEFEDLTENE